MTTDEMNIKVGKTARGFALIKFEDFAGSACSLQKSSISTEDCIWIGCDAAEPKIMASEAAAHGVPTEETCGWIPFPVPEGVLMNTRMHLTRDQVTALLPYFQRFVDTGEIVEKR